MLAARCEVPGTFFPLLGGLSPGSLHESPLAQPYLVLPVPWNGVLSSHWTEGKGEAAAKQVMLEGLPAGSARVVFKGIHPIP